MEDVQNILHYEHSQNSSVDRMCLSFKTGISSIYIFNFSKHVLFCKPFTICL